MRKKCGEVSNSTNLIGGALGFADSLERTSRDLKKRLTNLRFGRRRREERRMEGRNDNHHQRCGTIRLKSKKAKLLEFPLPCLPDQVILYDILPRLPVKSLRRFSCVSKLWCETVGGENQEFLSRHTVHSKQKAPLILGVFHVHDDYVVDDDDGEEEEEGYIPPFCYYKFVSFDLRFDRPNFSDYLCFRRARCAAKSDIVGYCNGLICIRVRNGFDVTNISTREVLLLPPPPPLPSGLHPDDIVRYGFGFDPLKSQYKLVQLVDGIRCLVFTLGTNINSSSWRGIPIPAEVSRLLSACSQSYPKNGGLYVARSLHWLIVLPELIIVSFNIHTEEFVLIPTPIKCSGWNFLSDCYLFFEFKGLLCCGYHDNVGLEEEEGVSYDIHLFWLLNDPLSNPNPNPNWRGETIPFSEPSRVTTIRLTFFLDRLVFFDNYDVKFFMFYHQDPKKFTYMPFSPPGMCLDLLSNPLFINHVENLVSLKTLVPPGAGSDLVRYVNQDPRKRITDIHGG